MENQRIVADTLSGKGESMADMEKLLVRIGNARDAISRKEEQTGLDYMIDGVLMNCSVMLKEQDERLRKLQKDKDNLCLEISEWKHKFHDAPPKFVSQGVVDQIRWERDTALSQLEQIGKGLGSKMDDVVALLKEQEWIPISERLPENAEHPGAFCPKVRVLTCWGESYGWYNPDMGAWYFLVWHKDYELKNIDFERGDIPCVSYTPKDTKLITHWKPIP